MGGRNGYHRGAIIQAPTARAMTPTAPAPVPTKEEIIQLQAAQIQELEAELAQRTVQASTIANAAINLLDRLAELGYGSRDLGVVIERDTWQKTVGLQLSVSGDQKTGKVTVRAREQEKPAPIVAEDRSEF